MTTASNFSMPCCGCCSHASASRVRTWPADGGIAAREARTSASMPTTKPA
jgi:hypothetical protein